ncbi:PepSY domain-containing protein, partial [Sphingomonas bacterium]|uniref:PepSY domain-containing protein n=1 Tax=Sphingomonas bacterium TaxID=1895847 RepID=UPI0015775A41
RGLLAPNEAAGIVARHADAPAAGVSGPIGYDQWIVHDQFDPLRPFYRVDLADGRGTRFYVSARSGDIVQRTTRWQRGWNWPGAVLHWAYVVPLRSSFTAWDRTVWTVSLIALLVAVAGMGLGIWRTVQVRRAGRRRLTWFRRRWMRWHHLGGLFVGAFVVSWILSGWLSMDHGRLFSRGRPTAAQRQAYAGMPLASAAAAFPIDRLRRLPSAVEIRFEAIGGLPLAAVVAPSGRAALWSPAGRPLPGKIAAELMGRGLARAWPGSSVPATVDAVAPDSFYALAEGLAPGARLAGGSGTRPPVYLDGDDGRIATVMSRSRAAYAWIYYALHSFNFPGLSDHPWLRDVVVLIPLGAGFLFSVTGAVLGWRRLGRGWKRPRSRL